MWIYREIEQYLVDLAQKRPAILLTGSRQTGKTSLLTRVFPQHQYISLDLPRDAEEAETSGESFLTKHSPPVIIDEIQQAPGILPYLKRDIDKHRNKNGRIFLTGSQKFPLMQGVSESLAGRCSILECHSLSAREYAHHFKKKIEKKALLEWMMMGGYPEIHAKSLEPQRFYSDYLGTYLERDVRNITQVQSLRDFDRFLRLCAIRSGQLLSYSSIATEVGVSPNTVKNWISILEASNIIFLLEPYYRNLGKRSVKSPKLYFLDTGILCFLLNIRDVHELERHSHLGQIFETHFMGQVVRHFANQGLRAPIYFFRDHHGHEVDLLVQNGDHFILAECKWAENPKLIHDGFDSFENLVGKKSIARKSIVTPVLGSSTTKAGICLDDSVEVEFLKSDFCKNIDQVLYKEVDPHE